MQYVIYIYKKLFPILKIESFFLVLVLFNFDWTRTVVALQVPQERNSSGFPESLNLICKAEAQKWSEVAAEMENKSKRKGVWE